MSIDRQTEIEKKNDHNILYFLHTLYVRKKLKKILFD